MITLREMRDSTHMTQKEFAEKFEIPLATYRKWEQGEATPAPYIVKLIAAFVPSMNKNLRIITSDSDQTYYYDKTAGIVFDNYGSSIHIHSDLDSVKKENLPIYLDRLFSDYRDILEKFERDCRYDIQEDIIWTRG